MPNPLPESRWTPELAAHLLNRAGFGGSPDEIAALHARGRKGAVEAMLDGAISGTPAPAWSAKPAEPIRRELMSLPPEEQKQKREEFRMERQEESRELVVWWMQRMRTTANPLREKMTVFWHGHFATSIRKVVSPRLMWRQNETLRQEAFRDFGTIVRAMSRDPAMLIWLDLHRSRRDNPNENWARELMELFTLGVGHYSETDVKESARAFTGYRIGRGAEFRFWPREHDDGSKTFLGQKGEWSGDDIIRIILEQPQCARFLCEKIWEFFVEDPAPPAVVNRLANAWVGAKYDVPALLRIIFSSEEFYAPAVRRTQIKSPVQWVISTARMLEIPLPGDLALLNALRQLGQVPFAPPNVKGWAGGKSWISASTLLFRYNLAGYLVGAIGRDAEIDYARIAPDALRDDPRKLVDALITRLFQEPIGSRERATFLEYAERKRPLGEKRIAGLLHLMMSTPQFQLT
jgi:uncharacterized protein (DUF1800 family)